MEKGAKGKQYKIYMFSLRLIARSMNDNYMVKKAENIYHNKVKCPLFSVTFSKKLSGKEKYVLEP